MRNVSTYNIKGLYATSASYLNSNVSVELILNLRENIQKCLSLNVTV